MRDASWQLQARIVDSIKQAGGWIPFDQWMAQALYTPGLGYYSGLHGLGEEGDFVTAPEISPLFSRVVARQIAPVLVGMKSPSILEFGAGSGVMAADILLELESQQQLPESYSILELSGTLRARQQETIAQRAPHLLQRVNWLEELPQIALQGVVIANEVMDAIPCERFVVRDDKAVGLGVVVDENGEFAMGEQPAETAINLPSGIDIAALEEGYSSELRPGLAPWISSISDFLQQGMVLLVDYGYSRAEYYRPERSSGTLSCFYRHHKHEDALALPGLQDITAHVDFTTVAEAADESGLSVAGYTTQAYFLLAGGIAEMAEGENLDDTQTRIETSKAIQQLTMPAQMGDVVKVMALTRDIELPETFTIHDQLHTL